MIAPLATPERFKFKQRSGSVHIISPEAEEFTTDGIKTAIREFIEGSIAEKSDTGIVSDLQSRPICHPDVNTSDIDEIISDPKLSTESLVDDAMEVLRYITSDARLSDEVGPRGTPYMSPLRKFKGYLRQQSEDYDIVVPFFISSSDSEAAEIRNDDDILEQNSGLEECDEFIRIHCLTIEDGMITECDTPAPFGISW